MCHDIGEICKEVIQVGEINIFIIKKYICIYFVSTFLNSEKKYTSTTPWLIGIIREGETAEPAGI